jgi:DNA-binding transcriptional MerR regulator
VSDTGQPAPARPQKGAAAFRTIGEAADELNLPTHVLRFWETKFPQLKPLKRSGGRRYYRPEDIRLLRQIRQWLYEDGYTIRGVQQLLESRPPETARTGEEVDLARAAAAPSGNIGSDPAAVDVSAPDLDTVAQPPLLPPPDPPHERGSLDPALRSELEEIRRELLQARALLKALLRQTKAS